MGIDGGGGKRKARHDRRKEKKESEGNKITSLRVCSHSPKTTLGPATRHASLAILEAKRSSPKHIVDPTLCEVSPPTPLATPQSSLDYRASLRHRLTSHRLVIEIGAWSKSSPIFFCAWTDSLLLFRSRTPIMVAKGGQVRNRCNNNPFLLLVFSLSSCQLSFHRSPPHTPSLAHNPPLFTAIVSTLLPSLFTTLAPPSSSSHSIVLG